MVVAKQKEFLKEAVSYETDRSANHILATEGLQANRAFWAELAERETREMQAIRCATTFDLTNLQKVILDNFPNLRELTIRCTDEAAEILRTRNIPQLTIVKD